MSAPWAGGSTYAWRRLRIVVLNRDSWRCQIPKADGSLCLAPATHVDHIVPRSKGGAHLDMANLRAACAPCNLSRGPGRPPRTEPAPPRRRRRPAAAAMKPKLYGRGQQGRGWSW